MQSFTGFQGGGPYAPVLATDARGVIYLGAGSTLVRPGDDPTGTWVSGLPSGYAIFGIGFDPQNNAVLLTGANQHTHVVKLDRLTGQNLVDYDLGTATAQAMTIDASGAVYVVGAAGTDTGIQGFIAKLDPNLQNQIYFTILDSALPRAVAADSTGRAYVVEMPLTVIPTGPPSGGSGVHFGTNTVYLLDSSGAIAVSQPGGGAAVAINNSGNVVVTGGSYPASGVFQVPCGPRTDLGGLAVTVLDPQTLQAQSSAMLAQQTLASASSLLPDGSLFLATQSGRVLHVDPAATSSPVACVVDGASFQAETTVVPGQLLTIFGRGLGDDPMSAFDDSQQLPFSSNGTVVRIGGVLAPLLAVSSTQINTIVPFEATGATAPVNIEISRNDNVIYTWPVIIGAANPQPILSFGSQNQLDYFMAPVYQEALSTYPVPLALVLNQDGSVNSAANPAHLGSTVTILASGFGQLFGGAVVDGAPGGSIPQWPLEQFPVSTPNGILNIPLLGVGTIAGHSNSLLRFSATVPADYPAGPLPFVIGPLPSGPAPVWTNFFYTAQ